MTGSATKQSSLSLRLWIASLPLAMTKLAIDQDRDRGMGQHLQGFAAKDRRNSAQAVGRHHDEIATVLLRRVDDRLIGLVVFDTQRAAIDASLDSVVFDIIEILCGLRSDQCLVLIQSPRDDAPIDDEGVKRCRYHEGSHFGPDRFRQSDPVFHRSLRQLRPVSGKQNVLVHGASPPVLRLACYADRTEAKCIDMNQSGSSPAGPKGLRQ